MTEHLSYAPPHVRQHAERMLEMMKNGDTEISGHENFDPPRIDPLDDLASIMRRLTYGQMVELAEGLGVDPDVLHKWSHDRST